MTEYPKGAATPVSGPHKGRQTIYRGVTMRSRTEATAAQFFDEKGIRWEYEPVCYAGPSGQYLPDFRIYHPLAPEPIFVEVKAAVPANLADLEAHMAVVWDSEPAATFLLMVFERGALVSMRISDPAVTTEWMDVEQWASFLRIAHAITEEYAAYRAAGGLLDEDEFVEAAWAPLGIVATSE